MRPFAGEYPGADNLQRKHVEYGLAMKRIDFVAGPEGQSVIADWKTGGEPLFFVYGKGGKH